MRKKENAYNRKVKHRGMIVLVISLVITISAGTCMPAYANDGLIDRNRAIFLAHMGYSAVAPENSLAAISEAAYAGFDGVEFDVYESKKEKSKKYKPYILLTHDKSLGRLTGKHMSATKLTHKNIGSYRVVQNANGLGTYGSYTFPTLQQALHTAWSAGAAAGNPGIIVEIDIKQSSFSKAAARKVVRLCGSHRVRINTTKYNVVRMFKKCKKSRNMEIWMYKEPKSEAAKRRYIRRAAKLKVNGVSMPDYMWNDSIIAYAKKYHLKLAAKTNSVSEADRLINHGFERICTDWKMFY